MTIRIYRPLALAVTSALLTPVTTVMAEPRLEEVLVTAEHREQDLQNVPVAVTALTNRELQERNIVDFDNYLRTVPGATLQDLGALGGEVKFRGIGNGTAEVSATTAVYLGEVPVIHTGRSVNSSYNFWLVDLERIEALRGPQGQLYGANSLGGAIKNVPQAPELDQFGLRGSATLADTRNGGNSSNADLTLNLPIARDVFGLRLTAYSARQGGWYDNVFSGGIPLGQLAPFAPPPSPPPSPPPPGAALPLVLMAAPEAAGYSVPARRRSNVNETDIAGARLLATWRASDRLEATFMFATEERETSGAVYAEAIAPNPGFIPGTHLIPNTQNPLFSTAVLSTSNYRNYEFSDPAGTSNDDEIKLASLVIDYDLGFVSLLSSTAWWERKAARDFDFSYPVSIMPTGVADALPGQVSQRDRPENLSQEFRLRSTSGERLDWMVGLFLQRIDQSFSLEARETSPFNLPGLTASLFSPPGAPPPPPYLTLQTGEFRDDQAAIYGQLDYSFTETLRLSTSFRYFRVDQEFFDGVGAFQVGQTSLTNSDTVFTPKVNLSWHPAEGRLFYATAAEGFRTGVVNKVASPFLCGGALDRLNAVDGAVPSSDPDYTVNYELGTKLSFADGRFTVNAAVYRIDWSDLQTQVGLFAVAGERACQSSAVLNVGDARVEGAELEIAGALGDRWSTMLAASWIDGEYRDDSPPAGISAGQTIEHTPEFSLFASLRYDYALFGRPGYARFEWQYIGDQELKGINYVTQHNPEPIGDFHQFNLRVGLQLSETADLDFWGNNIFDEFGVVNSFDTGGLIPPTIQTIRPRTIGVTVRFAL